MKKLALLIMALLVLLTGVGRAAEAPHVILITIDGFPARLFWEAKIPLPHLRALAKDGVVAEALRVSNPTVTWPNHTTLITGVRAATHSVLYNGLLIRGGPNVPVRIEPNCDQAQLVAVPTLFELLHQAGLRTAAIDWPCTRQAAAVDDNFPDTPDNLLHTTPRLRQELVAQGVLQDETDKSFDALSGAGRDEVWIKAACQVIRARQPAFLTLHLLNTDGIHHRYGPDSPASHTALALADQYVGQLLTAVDQAGLRKTTTIFVLADHGFAVATNVLQPNVLLRQEGWLEVGASNKIVKARAQVVPEGGSGMIYLTDPQTGEADRQKLMELFQGKEGVLDVITPERYAALGFPSPGKHPGMADLLLVPKDGYAIDGTATGDNLVVPVAGSINRGYHGYLASNPAMNAPFIASGRGIRKNLRIGTVDNIDVAPTIARLFGQTLPSAEGKVLDEILEPTPP